MEVIVIGFFLLAANILYLIVRFILALVFVQQVVVSTSLIYLLSASLLPILWWMYSTKETEFNFYNRKGATLRLVIINASLVVAQGVWKVAFDKIIVKICTLPTGRNISEDTIYAISRLLLLLCAGLIGFLVYYLVVKVISKPDILEAIETFRWQHIVDTRENKNRLYDLKILRDIRTGSDVIIKEVDRFVHMFILGNSGTGKTSSTLTPSIICDLDHKIANKQLRDKALEQLVKEEKLRVARPKEGDVIDEFSLTPLEGYEKSLKAVQEKHPDAGITVLCPNAALLSDVAKLAKARGLKVNLIDPMDSFDDPCVRHVGINPFIIPLDLPADELQIQISNKAQQFAEVLLAVSEIHGSSDTYFRDINTAVTSNVAAMCMLRANLNGRQTDITEIQACINNFSLLKPVVAEIQKKLHMKITLQEIGEGGKFSSRNHATREDLFEAANDGEKPLQTNTPPLRDETEIPAHYRELGYTLKMYEEVLRQQAINYYEPLHYVLLELLGPGAKQMFDQARGLRNLLNKLIFDPRIKRIMSATDKNHIDWDKALLRGEITLINSALEIGAHGSTALGLFIMLSMKTAIMRRPFNRRSNHFLYIDEAAQYMHPMFEDMFALYRQYRVACVLAMQSLSQMEKTPLTKYLKGVIMGAGIHIVFGRLNAEEMRYYETLSGMEQVESLQKTVSKNSQLDANGRVTTMERTVSEQKSILEGHRIRSRDFQEVSVFMIDSGRVLKGFLARVAFPKEKDYVQKKVTLSDFSKYARFDLNSLNLNDFRPETLMCADTKDALSPFATSITTVNIREPLAEEDNEADKEKVFLTVAKEVSASKTQAQGKTDAADPLFEETGSVPQGAADALNENDTKHERMAGEAEENASAQNTEGEDKMEDVKSRRAKLLKAIDINETFRQFEQASKKIVEQKRKEEEAEMIRQQQRLQEEERLLREEEKRRRAEEDALKEDASGKEEDTLNIDFGAMLNDSTKDVYDAVSNLHRENEALPMAAGAEEFLGFTPPAEDVLAKLKALNEQKRYANV